MDGNPELPELPKIEETDLAPGDPGYNPFTDQNSPFFGLDPGWKPRADRPIPTMRCYYVRKDGTRCGNRGIRGSGLNGTKATCRFHGGSLPAQKRKSEEIVQAARIAITNGVPDAVMGLLELVSNGDVPEATRLRAITEVLDRAGLKAGTEVNVNIDNGVSPSDKIFEKLASLRGDKKPEELEDLGESEEIVEEDSE